MLLPISKLQCLMSAFWLILKIWEHLEICQDNASITAFMFMLGIILQHVALQRAAIFQNHSFQASVNHALFHEIVNFLFMPPTFFYPFLFVSFITIIFPHWAKLNSVFVNEFFWVEGTHGQRGPIDFKILRDPKFQKGPPVDFFEICLVKDAK